jgi:hypothetical protein
MDTTDDPRWRRLAARPLGLVILALLVVSVAGWSIDGSSLQREGGSWGYTFAAFAFAVYAVPVIVVTAVCALLTLAVHELREVMVCAWIAALASALAGLLLVYLAMDALVGSPAGTVFGLVSLPVAASLLWPLVTCARRTRTPT